MGTTYHVTYSDGQQRNFKQGIDSLLEILNLEVSAYINPPPFRNFNRADSLFSLAYNPLPGKRQIGTTSISSRIT